MNAAFKQMAEGLAYFERRVRLANDSHKRWMRAGYQALAWTSHPLEVDKTTWGDGPWQDEPDYLRWPDLRTGLACRIERNHAGALCGYVGIPDNRAARRKWARAGFRTEDLRVHGGVTFDCQIGGLRWIGFDCAHYQDVSPAVEANLRGLGLRGPGSLRDWAIASERLVFPAEQYRDLQYVTAEVEGLAAQLAPRLFAQATHTCTFGTRPTTTGRDCKRCQLLGMAECTVEDA